MIAINSIIATFSQDDKQRFVAYLQDRNKRTDTKNILLFKLLCNGKTDSQALCQKLYNSKSCNAYHALRKRLFQSLIDFTANKNLEDENSLDMQIIKYILASRTFLLQKNYKVAYKILDKAEQLADAHLLFPILNEIYHTKIQYASDYPLVNLDELMLKQRENQKKHQLEDQLNVVYARLKSVLNAVSHKGEIINLETELEQILKSSDIELNESLSFKSLYQILAIANISAFVTTKYYEIEAFVLKSYALLKRKKETEKQLYYQIQIVYIIANTLFRNRKFEASLQYIAEMGHLMTLNKGTYMKTFILKKTLVEALNYNYSNRQEKAIEAIESIMVKKHQDSTALLDLHLSLLMFYFQKEDFRKSKSILSKFYHTDQWYIDRAGIDWVVKKNLMEILLYIELKDEDLFYSRLTSFKRRFSKYLKELNQSRILRFLSTAEQYYRHGHFKEHPNLKEEYATLDREDIFVISFYAWLKNKIDGGHLYKTTLQLLKQE